MKVKKNIPLSGYTSLRIGGIAKFFYEVESEEDIKEIYAITGSNVRVLAGGSNLLINDKAEFESIIYMNSLYQALSIDKNGVITASSSVPIQKFLKIVSQQPYSGAEYLNSLPAIIGGIVAMNAGR
jgi:UDP-N-acetylmuramate dehydrogenase